MSRENSYRQILKSSAIVGGASVLGIIIGMLRTKAIALLLGPSGVGLVGILNNLVATATTIASLGIGTSGIRQIAEAEDDGDGALETSRHALFLGGFALAVFGGAIFWALRAPLAGYFLDDRQLSGLVGWLALGVALNVAAFSQRAVLNGLRRIGDLARVAVYSSTISTGIGVSLLYCYHDQALVPFLLLSPLMGLLVGQYYVSRLPRPLIRMRPVDLWRSFSVAVRLGYPFMAAGLAVTVGQLVVRSIIGRELGFSMLGQFEAAWMISITYVGFVLNAMGADYYPRLTKVIDDPGSARVLVNQQTEVALLLSAPVLLFTLGFAPWIIEVLYSDQFERAAELLRWQVLGDILKVAAWPMTYVLLATGDGKSFFAIEALSMIIFSMAVWLGIPYLGLQAAGLGFFFMFLVNLPFVFLLMPRNLNIGWNRNVIVLFSAVAAVGVLVNIFCKWSELAGQVFALSFAAIFAVVAFFRLSRMAELVGPVAKLAGLALRVRNLFRDGRQS